MKHFLIQPCTNRRAARRSAFTLVEILVAVAIMSLLLAIILVPLRLGFESYHIGTARSGIQQEAQLTMQQMDRDFRRANFVFPNTRVSGISDNASDPTSACALQSYPSLGWNYLPYFRQDAPPTSGSNTDPADITSGIGITKPSPLKAIANTSRIDMLFLRKNTTKASAQSGEDYVVTYYPRRSDISKIYDPIDNPIVLFRAQYPYRHYERNVGLNDHYLVGKTGPLNAQIDWTKLPSFGSGSNDPVVDRSFLWITHNYFGEANLEPLCFDVDKSADPPPAGTNPVIDEDVVGSHTLVTPRGMQLVAPAANTNAVDSYIPELSFVESSSDGKRIDRVSVNMTLAQYDQAGAASVNGQGKAQRVPVSQTFDLPNAGCSN